MLILVTNDDGIHSPGIRTLADHLKALGQVVVVAPDRERSGAGHSLTLHLPLRAEEIGPGCFAVDGTPTDCVNLGIHGLLNGRPDLVVSGINRGANLGDDITYSGTVAAAMEATLMGVPAFALSMPAEGYSRQELEAASDFAVALARKIAEHGLPPDTFLNVNMPAVKPLGVMLTRQGRRSYGDVIVENVDPRGKKYYWIGGGKFDIQYDDGTDYHAVNSGHVSITPLHLDFTNYRSFGQLALWGLEELNPLNPDFK